MCMCVSDVQVVMTHCFHTAYVEDIGPFACDTVVIDTQVPLPQRRLLPPFLGHSKMRNCTEKFSILHWGGTVGGTCKEMGRGDRVVFKMRGRM
jgi:hypothetical protein